MRSVILSTLLLVLAVCTVSAQNRNTSICRLGFTYDISQSKNVKNKQNLNGRKKLKIYCQH